MPSLLSSPCTTWEKTVGRHKFSLTLNLKFGAYAKTISDPMEPKCYEMDPHRLKPSQII